MKRTQTKSYPFINQLSFWQKSTQTKRTLTDELPTVISQLSFWQKSTQTKRTLTDELPTGIITAPLTTYTVPQVEASRVTKQAA